MSEVHSHNLALLPVGAFIPTFLEKWAVITKFMPDIPGVEMEFTGNGGLSGKVLCFHDPEQSPNEEEFYPEAIEIIDEKNGKVCIFDERIHGYDAIQCDWKPEGERVSSQWFCKSCKSETFSAKFSWLGYQVFDEGWENSGSNLMEMRDSFDSIAIDLTCKNCGHLEAALVEAELA